MSGNQMKWVLGKYSKIMVTAPTGSVDFTLTPNRIGIFIILNILYLSFGINAYKICLHTANTINPLQTQFVCEKLIISCDLK